MPGGNQNVTCTQIAEIQIVQQDGDAPPDTAAVAEPEAGRERGVVGHRLSGGLQQNPRRVAGRTIGLKHPVRHLTDDLTERAPSLHAGAEVAVDDEIWARSAGRRRRVGSVQSVPKLEAAGVKASDTLSTW
jgi:hypothetical protein